MPSSFTCEIKIDSAIPDFADADIPLKQIAEKVVTDSQKNIRQQTFPDGRDYEPLSKKTIKDKIKQGVSSTWANRALYRKGIMYRAIHAYKLGKNEYVVGVKPVGSPKRDYVAGIHAGGASFNLPIRQFLGMSQQTISWANARIKRWLIENTQKAAHKFINLKY